jgi:hypothetical protein
VRVGSGKPALDVASHDLAFNDDVKLPGCYHVRAVVRLEATH